MARCAVVDKNNVVVNVVVADPSVDTAPEGMTLVATDMAGPGWLWDGTAFTDPTPLREPVAPQVPKFITPRQCRLLLLRQGLLASVEATIAQSTEDVRISWEYASEFRRDDPILLTFATALGFSDTAIDQFFIAAAQL